MCTRQYSVTSTKNENISVVCRTFFENETTLFTQSFACEENVRDVYIINLSNFLFWISTVYIFIRLQPPNCNA